MRACSRPENRLSPCTRTRGKEAGICTSSNSPCSTRLGSRFCLGGIAIDVTEQKQAQEALRRSHEQLHALAARLLAAEEELARRVARELHDDLNQRLAALAVELGIHARELPEAAAETRERLLSAQQSVAGFRRMCGNWRANCIPRFWSISAWMPR